jgi:formylglycine-generating enzyme required for sulfatase activity
MSGNVGEITLSCYSVRYNGWSTTSEWLENSFRESCERVTRGGAYAFSMDVARVAWRGQKNETYRTSFSGFRVLKELYAD